MTTTATTNPAPPPPDGHGAQTNGARPAAAAGAAAAASLPGLAPGPRLDVDLLEAPRERPGAGSSSYPPADDPQPRQISMPLSFGRTTKLNLRLVGIGLVMAFIAGAATCRAWKDVWQLADAKGDNSHILLAPLVVLWLAWVRRGRLPHIRVSGRWVGLALIMGGWILSAFGLANSVAAAFHAGSLGIVVGAFVSVCGKGVILRFLPAAAALLFLVPVPGRVRDDLAIPLQTITAVMTDGVLDLLGVDSHVAGNTLVVDGTTVMVAEACNGMPMVFGLVLVTYAFAFAWPMRNGVRWALLLLAPVVTLGCNVLRTVPLVWTYAHRSREAADWLHAYSGWVMLPVAFFVLLLAVRALRWFDVPVERYRLAAQ